MITIKYWLSEKGQKANLLAGGDGNQIQLVNVKNTEPIYPDALELASVSSDGTATLDTTKSLSDYELRVNSYGKSYDQIVDAETLVKDEQERRAAFVVEVQTAKEKDKENDENQIRELAQKPMEFIRPYSSRWNFSDRYSGEPRLEAVRAEARKLIDEHNAEVERKETEKKLAEKEAKIAEEKERKEWIAQHGSERLNRCSVEGIECKSVYEDERLAVERPGWEWAGYVDGKYNEPRNPPVEAFAILDAARAVDPQAKLVYWTVEHKHDGSCDYDDCPKYDKTCYAAVGMLLGCEIVFFG